MSSEPSGYAPTGTGNLSMSNYPKNVPNKLNSGTKMKFAFLLSVILFIIGLIIHFTSNTKAGKIASMLLMAPVLLMLFAVFMMGFA